MKRLYLHKILTTVISLAAGVFLTGFTQEPLEPPPTTPDYSDLERTLKSREAAESKRRDERVEVEKEWTTYQTRMKSAFAIVRRLDDSESISVLEKRRAWQRFIDDFSADNPLVVLDNRMLDHGRMRIEALIRGVYLRFNDKNNGTVFDMQTGAYWTLKDSDNRLTWQQAKDYCANLYIYYCKDWRLPLVSELEVLYDAHRENPPHWQKRGRHSYMIPSEPITIKEPFTPTDKRIWSATRIGTSYYAVMDFTGDGGPNTAGPSDENASALCICVPYEEGED